MLFAEVCTELHGAVDHIVVRHETAHESHHDDRRLCSIHWRRNRRIRQPILSHDNESRANENASSD